MTTNTNNDINYQGGPFGGRGGRTGRSSIKGMDETESADKERDIGARADMEASKRGRAVVRLQSLPNGEYRITNAVELKAVIREWQGGLKTVNYSGYEVQRHIIRRARDLKLVSLLPNEWGVNLEIMSEAIRKKKALLSGTIDPILEKQDEVLVAEEFQSFLLAEGKTVPFPQILQESDGMNSTMRVKVPFYIGGSVSNAPGFPRRILFPTNLLQEIVKTGKERIAASVKPITVYARHAHAADANYLPIGGVSDLIAEGGVGYAVLDIEPTTYGRDAQVLLRATPPKLNAVSLRSGKNSFEMEDVEVNGEKMFRPKRLELDGIDFAPDSPAMQTYGIEILQEDVVVKTINNKKEEITNNVEKLTLEMVKASPEIVSEIEKPLVERIDSEVKKTLELEKTVKELQVQIAKAEVADFAREIAAKHPKSAEVLPVLLEIAATCASKDEFSTKTFPILLEALSATPKEKVVIETAEDKLRKLFNVGGDNGNGLTREEKQGESLTQEEELKGEHVGPLEVPNF